MNATFVRHHLRSGKSRMRPSWRYPKSAWFGAPKSAQFLRAYPKPEVQGFRLELQFNWAAIQKYGLEDLDAWANLREVMVKRVAFYRVDWNRLTVYVRRHFPRHPDAILDKARALHGNLDELLRFLRRASVSNPSRFLAPLPLNYSYAGNCPLNGEISRALSKWRRQWNRDGRG